MTYHQEHEPPQLLAQCLLECIDRTLQHTEQIVSTDFQDLSKSLFKSSSLCNPITTQNFEMDLEPNPSEYLTLSL